MIYRFASFLQRRAWQAAGCARQESDMSETTIAADVGPAQPTTWPLLRKLRSLVKRLRAARRAHRLAMIARIQRLGLSHID
jgi:hypothetical protein